MMVVGGGGSGDKAVVAVMVVWWWLRGNSLFIHAFSFHYLVIKNIKQR